MEKLKEVGEKDISKTIGKNIKDLIKEISSNLEEIDKRVINYVLLKERRKE